MGRKKSAQPPKRRIESVKALRESGLLTPKQSLFIKAFAETRNKGLAAIAAGYGGHPSKAGHQAFKAIAEKAPEVIARMGITLEAVIEHHVLRQMNAMEVKLAQHEGKFTDFVELPAWNIQQNGTHTLLELMNAFPLRDQGLSAQLGVEVIVNDMPRPHRPTIDVAAYLASQKSRNGYEKETLELEKKANPNGSDDPRPKD
jgi:phage terminase small subunit